MQRVGEGKARRSDMKDTAVSDAENGFSFEYLCIEHFQWFYQYVHLFLNVSTLY